MRDYFCPFNHPLVRLLSLGRARGKVPGIWDETDARWGLGRKIDKQHVG